MKMVKNAVALSLFVGAAAVAVDAGAAGPAGGAAGGGAAGPGAQGSGPITAYIKFIGQSQGPFDGAVTVKGHERQSLVIGLDYGVASPTDLSTGLASGKRQHSPFVITKEFDGASPQIFQALVDNENLPTVEVDLVRGSETFYKYVLTDAHLTNLHQSMTTNCVGSAPCKAVGPDGNIVGPDTPVESVAMVFRHIEVTYVPGTKGLNTAGDSWFSPVGK